jgi:hypothetical protein
MRFALICEIYAEKSLLIMSTVISGAVPGRCLAIFRVIFGLAFFYSN